MSLYAIWTPQGNSSQAATQALENLSDSICRVRQGFVKSRLAVQIRSFRYQHPGKDKSSARPRTMYLVRSQNAADTALVVEDPLAPSRSTIVEEGKEPIHYRLSAATVTTSTVDQFLSRSLVTTAPSNGTGWVPRPAATAVNGLQLSLGDFEVRCGIIAQKGGQGGATGSTILLEIEYLPSAELMDHTMLRDFLSNLLPDISTELKIVDCSLALREAGLTPASDRTLIKAVSFITCLQNHM